MNSSFLLSIFVATQTLFSLVATNNACGYMSKSIMLRLRVEPEFKQLLQKAIAEGKAETMSELIRKAVTKFLEGEVSGKV